MHEICQCDECKKERAAPKWRPRSEIFNDLMDPLGKKSPNSLIIEVLCDIRDMLKTQDARLSDIRDVLIDINRKDFYVKYSYWYPYQWTYTTGDLILTDKDTHYYDSSPYKDNTGDWINLCDADLNNVFPTANLTAADIKSALDEQHKEWKKKVSSLEDVD